MNIIHQTRKYVLIARQFLRCDPPHRRAKENRFRVPDVYPFALLITSERFRYESISWT